MTDIETAARLVLEAKGPQDLDNALVHLRVAVMTIDMAQLRCEIVSAELANSQLRTEIRMYQGAMERQRNELEQTKEALNLARKAANDAQNGYIPIIRDDSEYASERLAAQQGGTV